MGKQKMHGNNNQQLWHLQPNGTIQCCGTKLVLDGANMSSNPASANLIVCDEHGGAQQQWKFEYNMLVNASNPNIALDVYGGAHGNTVCTYEKHGRNNQQWELVFAGVHHH